jgi:Family of unknown function (DUF5320)
MPRGDGTGPLGQGPMTGRGAGYCSRYAEPGYASRPAFGRGMAGPDAAGWCGRGHGYRNRFYATGAPFRAYGPDTETFLGAQEEAALLKSDAERLRSVLERVERRLEKLETT